MSREPEEEWVVGAGILLSVGALAGFVYAVVLYPVMMTTLVVTPALVVALPWLVGRYALRLWQYF